MRVTLTVADLAPIAMACSAIACCENHCRS